MSAMFMPSNKISHSVDALNMFLSAIKTLAWVLYFGL